MYELFEDKRSFYIITEVCRGGELKEELAQCGTYTEEQTQKLMREVLGCVNYFHKQKIVHRDLKPGEFQFYGACLCPTSDPLCSNASFLSIFQGNILLEENKKLDQIKVCKNFTSIPIALKELCIFSPRQICYRSLTLGWQPTSRKA